MGIVDNALAGASGQGGAYNIERSLRLRGSASAYLNRTPASAGNRKTFTISKWIKRGTIGVQQQVITVANTGANYYFYIRFLASDALEVFDYNSGGAAYIWQLQTTQVFRDPSAWYHIVISVDTTQATASNRVKIYVNGVQVSSFAVANYPSLNFDTQYNFNGASYISSYLGSSQYLDGYLTEVNSIDGQALTPSSFGETDIITGVWKPKKYTGTYGTNGFYLKFNNLASTSTLGNDSSGNSNTWTVNNVSLTAGSTYDSMTDVPTLTSATSANYPVLNRLIQNSYITMSNGNLTAASSTNDVAFVASTMTMTSGNKYYFELRCQTSTGANFYQAVGIWSTRDFSSYGGTYTTYFNYNASDGTFYNGSGSVSYGATWTNGDVIGVAVDLVNGTLTFYKNGTSQGVAKTGIDLTLQYYADVYLYTTTASINFGQQPFAYTPPTGFVALNTFNLPDSTIVAGNTNMDVLAWTGTSTASGRTFTGLQFQPDFIWSKARSGAGYSHQLYDSNRGAGKRLQSNTNDAETTNPINGYVSTFNSDGFTTVAGTDNSWFNELNTTYVGWNWKAGGTAVSNTAGTITSTVSANTSAGFSIVTYTGNGTSSASIGHGLGVSPSMILFKTRGAADNWLVHHQSFASNNNYLSLNATDAVASATGLLTKSSTTITFPTSYSSTNQSGRTYVAYCWSEIAGFSRFGSYTGNGSANGPFIYTGFRPKFVMFKRTDSAVGWGIIDSSRNTFNFANELLEPNTSNAVQAYSDLGYDFLSNGFKARGASANTNANGGTYIYAAFAENPFKNSLAR